jgi:hypothetical protein
VELFEEIRREYEFGVGAIAGVAWKPKVRRRMVREAVASALPKPRKKAERARQKLQAAIPFIDQILQSDRQAPRKQRRTAHRIWVRLRQEAPDCQVAERTVREYVHDRKLALGLLGREVCVAHAIVTIAEMPIRKPYRLGSAAGIIAGERRRGRIT